MAQKPGTLVTLKCEGCPCSFTYRLTKSPFRKKFCPDCAETRTYENKRRFDEKRKAENISEAIDEAKRRKKLREIPDYPVNPASLISAATKGMM